MKAIKRSSLFLALCCASLPTLAEQFGPVEISGFLVEEVSIGNHRAINPTTIPQHFDERGILGGNPPRPTHTVGINTNIQGLTLGVHHEFDNAIKVAARASKRWRNGEDDIYGEPYTEKNVSIEHPGLGSLTVGTQLSRSWSRSDSFTYPYGLANKWAESGAGYGVYERAIRYMAPKFESDIGKLAIEFTYAHDKRNPLEATNAFNFTANEANTNPGQPRAFEFFAQYSRDKHLIEYTFQHADQAWQSSFAKGGLVGGFGNTDGNGNFVPNANAPRDINQNVHLLQGEWYFKEGWKMTYGLRRNTWSGSPGLCAFAYFNVPNDCTWPYGGFNYGPELTTAYEATSWDKMLGVSYTKGLWTYAAGGVHLGKAQTKNPAQWGQDNSLFVTNLSISRKVPEIYKNVRAYVQWEHLHYTKNYAAPISQPNNIAYFVDPRSNTSANSILFGISIGF